MTWQRRSLELLGGVLIRRKISAAAQRDGLWYKAFANWAASCERVPMTSDLTTRLDDFRVRLRNELVAPRNTAAGLIELADLVAELSRQVDGLSGGEPPQSSSWCGHYCLV